VMVPISAKSVYLYSMNRFYSRFIVEQSQLHKLWASYGVKFLIVLQIMIEVILLSLYSVLVNIIAVPVFDRDELQYNYVCKSKSLILQTYKNAVVFALFAFNISILLVSSVFAFLNRNLSQELTENSQIICMLINFYAFILRLPLLLDGSLSPSLEFNNAGFILGTALFTQLTICGTILTSTYYEVIESAKGKTVHQRMTKNFQKLKLKIQKGLSNISLHSVLQSMEEQFILDSDDTEADDFIQKLTASYQRFVR
jgi:hypothetical protein